MDDCLIIGGGVIGLSLAWELAGHGQRVRIVERNQPGSGSSWAGAGIFPPGRFRPDLPPISRMVGLCNDLLPQWSERLKAETGVDNCFFRTGSLSLAADPADLELLEQSTRDYRTVGAQVEELTMPRLAELEPALDIAGSGLRAGIALPEETQLRNPRHTQALVAACRQRGVAIESDVEALDFQVSAGRIAAVVTNRGSRQAGSVCLATGAWSAAIAAKLGFAIPIKPIRGQIVLLSAERPILNHIINVGRRYFVPRHDGKILVGSTLEDVGFQPQPTASGVRGLLEFALRFAPVLAEVPVERCWAGLRPGTADGLPYLGPLPGLSNGFIAAGHYRAGLHLSPLTAILMGRLIRGEDPQFDLSPFRVSRPLASGG